MYIEIHNYDELEQKALYFKLNNAFNMEYSTEENIKLTGVYAIYNGDTCLYVGQSKNLASRIATHLRGKYKKATDIHIWDVESIGFEDFAKRSQSAKEIILNNCEKYLMSLLKPVDNLAIDMDIVIFDNQKPFIEFGGRVSFSLTITDDTLKIYTDYVLYLEDIVISIDRLHFIKKISTKTRELILDTISETSPIFFNSKKEIK